METRQHLPRKKPKAIDMSHRSLTFLFLCCITAGMHAQKNRIIDRRDQAEGWYLPVECNVMANGGPASGFAIAMYKDNQLVKEIPAGKKASDIELDLDIDGFYSIRFTKPGFREKLVCIDTHLPESQVKYGKYICHVNLEPLDKFAHSDPFYLDFPGAMVRWNEEKQAFMHNDEYLAEIQSKVAMLGAQIEPR